MSRDPRWKRWGRSLSAAVVIAAWGLAGCGRGGGQPADLPLQRVGAWQVGAANNPDPAKVGDNTITVVARDSSGKPLRGSVEVIVSMPQMGAMPAMESRGKVKPVGAGVFHAAYGLPMGGEWDVAVRLRPERGRPAEVFYRLSTSIRGLTFASGTPPSGVDSSGSMPTATTARDSGSGAVTIDDARRQSLGIRTERVEVRHLTTMLHVPGRVAYDEAHQAEVSTQFNGWVRRLTANVTGQPVRRGSVLFLAYSPELWSAQQEYLEAARAAQEDRGKASLGNSSAELADAARERLSLWDISSADIDAITKAGRPLEALPIRSPVSGVITEKNLVQGSAFQAGQVLFRIAQLDPVWVIVSVPQRSVLFVRNGMTATIRDPYQSAGERQGRVSFVYPALDSMTRTAEVRIETRNADGRLQPGAFVDVELAAAPLEGLAVPESAVLPTGERFVVFVDLGDGRLAPREVQLGARAGGYYEVLAGLHAGEVVVTSGNFLVAAESKLRTAGQAW